ncbi:MAG: hypothetical protein KDI79_23990 [Anaerolineae bacterium]|nr:hypothetical protein [Anaerolineae bacterium]
MKQSKFLKPIGLLLLTLLLVAGVVAPAAAQEPEEGDVEAQFLSFLTLLWNPASTYVARGDGTVLTKLNIVGAEQIHGFTIQVEYDASVIKPESVEPGSLLPGTKGVDYFFTVQTGATAGGTCGDTAFNVNVVYFDPTVQINGTGDLLEILWRSDPDAAVGNVGWVCVDGTESTLVDNGGFSTPLPSTSATIEIEPANIFKFQIGLEGGKNSGLEEPTSSTDIVTEVTINGIYPCDGGMVDLLGFCAFNNATALPPYDIKVSRFGYLDAETSFDDPQDSTAIWLWAGDLNDDNVVNILDIQLMVSVLNAPVGTNKLSVAADFTGPGAPPAPDGVVNIIDLVLLAKNFGMSGPTNGAPGGGGSFPF